MRSLAIVSIALSINAVSARLRGVSPEDASKYIPTPESKWACLNNPEIVLDFSQLNDNYCDCPDGSDEPGTSACANGKFYCENKGHFPNYIPSFQVDDGVCDYRVCCDGSDELGTVVCPNRCAELHQAYEQERAEKEKILKNGLAKKAKLEKVVVEEKQKISKEIEDLRTKLVKQQEKLKVLEENYDATQEEEESVLFKVSPYLDKLREKLSFQTSKISQLNSKIENLESIMEKLSKEYNPNFNDAAVKEGIRNFQDYLVNKEETVLSDKESDDSVIDSLIETISQIEIPRFIEDSVGLIESLQSQARSLFYQFIGVDIKEDTSSAKSSAGGKRNTNSDIQNAKSEITNLNDEITLLVNELNSANYGPNDILRSYKDKCLTKKYGEYEYKYCFTGTINQKGNGNGVLIGKYSKFETEGDMIKLIYEDGAKCWNGPIRQGIIDVECGDDDELLSVTEPEVCQYYFKVKSPIACVEAAKDEIARDEL